MLKIIFPTLNLRIERWKWNKEYRVYVSNQGHFKDEHKQNIYNRISQGGYVYIKTAYGYKSAHRLVMLTWKPIPNAESLTVDHLDHNKRDNSLSNLEWVSKKENEERAAKDKLAPQNLETVMRLISDNAIICTSTRMYKNIDEAVQSILNSPQQLNNPVGVANPENIKNNIIKAIANCKKYNGEIWTIEKR